MFRHSNGKTSSKSTLDFPIKTFSASTTLTDPTFVKKLYDHNIIVWGGDVRDQEAWSGQSPLFLIFTHIHYFAQHQKSFKPLPILSLPFWHSNPDEILHPLCELQHRLPSQFCPDIKAKVSRHQARRLQPLS